MQRSDQASCKLTKSEAMRLRTSLRVYANLPQHGTISTDARLCGHGHGAPRPRPTTRLLQPVTPSGGQGQYGLSPPTPSLSAAAVSAACWNVQTGIWTSPGISLMSPEVQVRMRSTSAGSGSSYVFSQSLFLHDVTALGRDGRSVKLFTTPATGTTHVLTKSSAVTPPHFSPSS